MGSDGRVPAAAGHEVMAFKFSEEFWGPQGFAVAQRCRCKYHSDLTGHDVWVSTSWNHINANTPSEVYEVTARATSPFCANDHGNATDNRVITRAQWDAANPDVTWDFFQTL